MLEITSDDLAAPTGSLAGPWVRFWARSLDLQVNGLIAGGVVGWTLPTLALRVLSMPGGTLLAGLLLAPLVMALEAAQFALFGTTLGKAIAGLRVVALDGRRMTVRQACARTWRVYLNGMILGLPIVSLVAYGQNYQRLKDGRLASWDADVGSRVLGGTNPARVLVTAILGILAAAAANAL